MPIADRHNQFCEELYQFFQQSDIRVEKDYRNEKIGFKIREAEVQKTPYMIIIGDAEVESGNLSVRRKGQGDLGEMKKEELLEKLREEINNKKSLTI
jgi:threonyl-tRNA synthetase